MNAAKESYIPPRFISSAPVRAALRYLGNRPDQLDYAHTLCQLRTLRANLRWENYWAHN